MRYGILTVFFWGMAFVLFVTAIQVGPLGLFYVGMASALLGWISFPIAIIKYYRERVSYELDG